MLAGCVTGDANKVGANQLANDYEVDGVMYRAELLQGQRYYEQERDADGRIKLRGGRPVNREVLVMDRPEGDPEVVVVRADGTLMTVSDEGIAMRVATMLCAEKHRSPAPYTYYSLGRSIPVAATTVWENGKWGVFHLCQ